MEDRRQMSGERTVTYDAEQWSVVARIRAELSDWVVIWSARKDEFQARPLFRAPKNTVAVGQTPEELAEKMLAIEQRCGKHPHRCETPAEPCTSDASD
jgi:hypothetical protein